MVWSFPRCPRRDQFRNNADGDLFGGFGVDGDPDGAVGPERNPGPQTLHRAVRRRWRLVFPAADHADVSGVCPKGLAQHGPIVRMAPGRELPVAVMIDGHPSRASLKSLITWTASARGKPLRVGECRPVVQHHGAKNRPRRVSRHTSRGHMPRTEKIDGPGNKGPAPQE